MYSYAPTTLRSGNTTMYYRGLCFIIQQSQDTNPSNVKTLAVDFPASPTHFVVTTCNVFAC